jgi:hypothetical protein
LLSPLVSLGAECRSVAVLVNDQKSRIGGINRDVSTPTLPYLGGWTSICHLCWG